MIFIYGKRQGSNFTPLCMPSFPIPFIEKTVEIKKKKTRKKLQHDPAIPLLGIYLKEAIYLSIYLEELQGERERDRERSSIC